jgi:hypothetical protein
MSDLQEKVELFLRRYEAALATDDFATIASLYNDTFLFGLPRQVHAVKAAGFAEVASKRRQQLKKQGLSQTHFTHVEVRTINAGYIEAKVSFDMNMHGVTKRTYATYFIFDDGKRLQIILQIDHQDLSEELSTVG